MLELVQIYTDVDEAEDVAEEDGPQRQQRLSSAPRGAFSSSTICVKVSTVDVAPTHYFAY
jgi:hypothetical protein